MQHPLTSGSVNFDGVTLTIIDHDGRRWITAEQLGQCLGYAPVVARQSVNKLYSRHQDEFTDRDTFVINMTSYRDANEVKMTSNPQGGNPNTRIFSDTGCNLVTFFANTPNAKRFRAFAKEVLAGHQQAQAISHAHYAALVEEIMSMRKPWAKLRRYHTLGLNNHEMGRLLGVNESTVRGWKARMLACGLIKPAAPTDERQLSLFPEASS